jgi:hypothetical protein
MNDVTVKSLRRTRESLSQTLRDLKTGSNPGDMYVVINDLAQVISERTGTWTDRLFEAKPVSPEFDPELLNGRLVVPVRDARRMLIERIEYEMERVGANVSDLVGNQERQEHPEQQEQKEQKDG